MITEKVAVLYRGGPESDARLHLGVGNHPTPPGCAGAKPQQVLARTYPYLVSLLAPASTPLLAALNEVAEQLAIRALGQSLTDSQRERLCQRCATDLADAEKPPTSEEVGG